MRVVIWGLKSVWHSHRYIHDGFFHSFKSLGYETYWVDDSLANSEIVKKDTLVIAVNVAAKNLPVVRHANYVLHNLDSQKFSEAGKVINLQVYTNASKGERLLTHGVMWDPNSKTLFQPWGLPYSEVAFMQPTRGSDRIEYWVGAVWNNKLNQGNSHDISAYKAALKNRGIQFRRVGGTRWFTKSGTSEVKSRRLINSSPIGAAIVGEWQREHSYVPCRFFKNIASGALPASNSDFGRILGVTGIYANDIDQVIDDVLNQSHTKRLELVAEAQEAIKKFTYEESILRIVGCFSN
jgi:hypothetical protein